MKTLLLLSLSLFFTACVSMPSTDNHPIDLDRALSGEALLGRTVSMKELPQEDLLGLDSDVRAYLRALAPSASPQSRLAALIRAFEQRDFTVEYDESSTLTAMETYRQARGNCLAFTLMMVAMARELGAEASFNQVAVPPVWSHDDAETFVVYRHVNMVSESARGRRVIDFNLSAYDSAYDQHTLDDTTAFALYYSNRGVELMRAGEREQAFLYLRKALELRPQRSDLWANLGAMYSHFGFMREAQQSYLQALHLKSSNLVAISNLERLHRYNGKAELADLYAKRARFHRERNPYFLFYQARDAYEQGDFKRAERRLRKAVSRHEDDHRFHFLLGLTRYQLGDMAASRQSFEEAFSRVTSLSTVNAYQRKLHLVIESE
ncbi:tetratricopeptide repeat protein [uncultured Microbulbifer sp.]|uniref:tetratricopeptide repeat protein n=1 Tax=uncultured Microbulbifer sp. TaxID=348147 RepID=UPI00262BBBE2|nr:tetratricopeptide repeat protein [uncultured Microbulbifer sp.]